MSDFVYAVQAHYDYEGFDIVGVFTSREKAYHVAKQTRGGDKVTVNLYPLDAINPNLTITDGIKL